MQLFSKISLTSLLILMFATLVFGQDSKPKSPGGVDWCGNSWGRGEDEAFLMNLAGAPLTLNISENKRDIFLSNITSIQIISYKLGSISKKKGVLTITRVTASLPVNLKVNEAAINPKDVDEELGYTRKKKAKLAVVEVTFADGSIWEGKI
jgi:hypothetical protein